ncbi:sulfatase-like hydrolase/transferase [Corynebacterium pygosceleis]|uniref:sulfatase-like hydrolase/transferase n=1 Tax=Corynebacterium pygosceleis TaxID=2800406 RepID=UPI001907A9B1|nr:sulfatase-like hydrolase/transferase [Corynebacterium pygosceleis]MCK7674729.1 sulfatase-like hydrolase/transferase [Corynebacterium pygosceleis]MCL0119682.1 sulfatase-like hydrolase/transferase [Corynebacterium pygosceleis]
MSEIPENVRNVIVIMTDQHRVDTIGCLGNPHAHTPNLDALGEDGFAFNNCYTPTAICTPARASLLTGKIPLKHQVVANPEWNIAYQCDFRPGEWTYTQHLRDNGYNVGLVGKYHVGNRPPDEFGMDDDSFFGAINPVAHEEYVRWLEDNGLPPVKAHDFRQGVLPGGRPGHVIAARLEQPEEATFERFLADRAIARMKEYAKEWKEEGKPFSLDIHFFGPHLPYFIPDEWFDLIDPELVTLPPSFGDTLVGKPQVQSNYATYWSTSSFSVDEWKKLIAVYWGYIAMIDFEIGRIMDAARDLGILDDTAVFFTADHGEFTGSHRLNDKGPAMYDDIYKVPFIAKIPGVSTVGSCDEFVSLLDLPATVLDIAGHDPGLAEDGRSIVDLTRGDDAAVDDWREDIVCEFHGHHFPLQQRMLRTRDFKLIISHEGINELYDLRCDPWEMNNVYDAPTYADIRSDLAKNLRRQLLDRGDEAFAKWMNAMIDYDVPLGGTSKSDWDNVGDDDKST